MIRALQNPATASPFAPLVTEIIDSLRKVVKIFQGKISEKTKLETTETQKKIVEQKKNRTQPPSRVDPQEVTIISAPTTQSICKAKPITPTPLHQIPFEEK